MDLVRLVEEIDRTFEERERNKSLAARIADGSDSLHGDLDQVIELVELMAKAHLNIPGPRVLQLIEEIRRLRPMEYRAKARRNDQRTAVTYQVARTILGEAE